MRKKGMRFLSLLMTFVLLISSVFCFPLSASAATIGKTTAYVNLRTGAGTGYSIIETVPQGAQITITDTSNKSWYRITAPSGKSGYMCSDYIQIIGESSDSGSISGVKYSARTTAYVNLRRGAGTNYSSILVVPQGATITVLAKTTSSWYQVQYGSYVGYMYAQYIQITGTIGTATATPKPTATPTAKPSTTPTATPKPTATPNPAAAQTGKTTAYVNLRSGAGTGYSIYLTVPQGATITVLDTSNPNWYKVKYSSYTGYMSSQYIQIQKAATPTPAPTPTPKPIGTAKTTAALNIRKGPGTSYASLGVLPSGTTVTVIEKCSNGWYRVKTAANVYGYCSGDYLKVTLGTATPTPKPTATPTPKPTASPTPKPTTAIALGKATTYVNLRQGPGTNYTILVTMPTDGAIKIFDMSNPDWYYVQYNTYTGYVCSDYVKITSYLTATPTPSPTPTPSEDLTIPSTSTLNIIQQYATKNDCYITNTRIRVEGLMLHSVGAGQPSAKAFADSFNTYNPDGREVCPHAFLQSDGTVYQILPWNMRGWHAGGTANNTHIGVEMCEPSSIIYSSSNSFYCVNTGAAIAYVAGTYTTATELFAELCVAYELDPLEKGVIISHSEGSYTGVASAHGDPEHLWDALGTSYTMDTFRRDIAKRVAAMK